MQKTKLVFLLPLSAVLISASISSCSTEAAKAKNQSNSAPSALPVDIKLAGVESDYLTDLIAGSTVANKEVLIVSEIPKKVVSVNFNDGSLVSKGQLLYKLDDRDIKAKIRRLGAELALSRTNEERLRRLLDNDAVKQEEYDQAKSKLDMLQAEQELLHSDLSKTEIRAPFSGRIGISKIQTGGFVVPGMTLTTLQDLAAIKINFAVSEKDINAIKTGALIEYETNVSKEKYKAKIVATEPSVDPNTRSIQVQAIAVNPPASLRGGLSARVFFIKSSAPLGIKIPTQALMPSANGYSVFVIKNKTAHLTAVQLASRNENDAFISSGINAGDSVMISNILRASEGIPISIASIN